MTSDHAGNEPTQQADDQRHKPRCNYGTGYGREQHASRDLGSWCLLGVVVLGSVATLHLIVANAMALLRGSPAYFHYDFTFFDWAFRVVWYGRPVAWMYDRPMQQAWIAALHYPAYPHNQFVYPPQFAVLFSWFGAFPFLLGARIWAGLSLAAYMLSGWLMSRFLFREASWLARLIVIGLWMGDYGYFADWTVGNANWLVFSCLCLYVYFRYARQQSAAAGIWLGLAVVIKASPSIVLAYCLLRRDWRTVFTALTTVAATTIITGLVLGWQILWWYVAHFSELAAESMKNGGAPYNVSLKGILMWLIHVHRFPRHASLVEAVFFAYVVAVAAVLVWQMRKLPTVAHGNVHKDIHSYEDTCERSQMDAWTAARTGRVDAAFAVITVLLFTPLIEVTHLIVLLIPLSCVFSLWFDSPPKSMPYRSTGWALLCAATYLLSSAGQWLNSWAHRQLPWLSFAGMCAALCVVFMAGWSIAHPGILAKKT
ncbi:MAG: DUF2029 domain-containing protein [Alicyclobacillus sp.]|nr:DUF2029 domain-containing protein [Alicyclobacillus sp.]